MQGRTTKKRAGRRIIGVALAAITTLAIAGCGGGNGGGGYPTDVAEPIQLDVNLVHSTSSLIYLTMQDVAERVAERTDGRVTLEVFPDSQLGSNEDAIEQALSGAPTIGHFSASAAATMGGVPEFLILGSAYVVPSADAIEPLVASDLYQTWTNELAENGFIVLAGNWLLGTRHIISTVPSGHPEPADLAGVTIRIPAGQQFATFFNATPAQPVNLDPSETYTGMEQGTVDAAEGPLSQMTDWSLDELGKSVTLTSHIVETTGFVMGDTTWAQISEADQAVLKEEFAKGGREYTEAGLAAESDIRAAMEADGIVFFDADLDAYRALAEEALMNSDAAADWPADLLEQVRAAMGVG